MKKHALSISFCLGILCCIMQGCDVVIPFQGPTGHPKFEDMDWQELEIKYWIVRDITNASKWNEDEKSLNLKGKELDALKKVFKTSSSNGTAQGGIRPWVLSTNKGEWYFELASPNTAFFCNLTNTERAYYIELNSTAFYEELKNVCLEKEKLDMPSIQFDNIRICRRFGGTQGPQEKIVSFQEDSDSVEAKIE